MRAIVACALAVCAAGELTMETHEIGKTQVAAVFEPARGTYQIDIAVDPDALLTRLQILSAGRVTPTPERDARDRAIAALGAAFLEATHVKVDGADRTPHLEYRPASALNDFAQAPSSVRLTGALPPGAKAFTVAHSITLGLTIYGLVSLPARVVEPMIALSIAYVAVENMITSELKSWRVALVFSFGLLHGMGFAGALRDLGMPRAEFLSALLTFNLGVEAGQLAVVAAAFLILAAWRGNEVTYRRLVVQPMSIAIAMIGIYWTVQRAI